jgi:predicted DNA-binding protein
MNKTDKIKARLVKELNEDYIEPDIEKYYANDLVLDIRRALKSNGYKLSFLEKELLLSVLRSMRHYNKENKSKEN